MREIAFNLIGARPIVAERQTVVEALGVMAGVQNIPSRRFVSIDDAAGRNDLADHENRFVFRGDNKRQGPATALAHGNHVAPLSSLMLGKPPVPAILFPALRPDVSVKIPPPISTLPDSVLPGCSAAMASRIWASKRR